MTWAYFDGNNVLFSEEGELKRTLQSLACGRARVLTKEPKVGLKSTPRVQYMY